MRTNIEAGRDPVEVRPVGREDDLLLGTGLPGLASYVQGYVRMSGESSNLTSQATGAHNDSSSEHDQSRRPEMRA